MNILSIYKYSTFCKKKITHLINVTDNLAKDGKDVLRFKLLGKELNFEKYFWKVPVFAKLSKAKRYDNKNKVLAAVKSLLIK